MKAALLFFLSLFIVQVCWAQDDALSMLEDDIDPYVIASFKTTRIVNGHSVEQTHAGVLDFRISHRFNEISNGIGALFGLDDAYTRIGFDYGITDRLMVSFGRAGYNRLYDLSTKYKLLRQSTENTGSPVTMNIVAGAEITGVEYPDPVRNEDFNSRLDYVGSLLIGRKFSEALTLQLSPTWVHRNLVETAAENNDIFSLGLGGRVKISKRVTFNIEYFFVQPSQLPEKFNNSFSVGVDVETGGHVFQMHLTNSRSMAYNGVIGETMGEFFKGDINFGFNISRVFNIGQRK